ncbi:hypothetical protein [Sharpea azabuensis]|uniref:hypothetical protein n=1 Tax=Sharpea azabuensis TaxID=322505 RepID=UPI0013D99B34|nr:hypothetical protein [Sharpea azabuensis]
MRRKKVSKKRYVVIGGVAAGATAAMEFLMPSCFNGAKRLKETCTVKDEYGCQND